MTKRLKESVLKGKALQTNKSGKMKTTQSKIKISQKKAPSILMWSSVKKRTAYYFEKGILNFFSERLSHFMGSSRITVTFPLTNNHDTIYLHVVSSEQIKGSVPEAPKTLSMCNNVMFVKKAILEIRYNKTSNCLKLIN